VDWGEDAPTARPVGSQQAVDERHEAHAQSVVEEHLLVSGQETSNVGEETAELDMRTVLKTEPPVRAAAPSAVESLEWEMPGEAASGATAEASVGTDGEGTEELVDDVLEETPDFLRDTPDQDRLWFEQQPPRDFDFDK
jgi:hypothetical protein